MAFGHEVVLRFLAEEAEDLRHRRAVGGEVVLGLEQRQVFLHQRGGDEHAAGFDRLGVGEVLGEVGVEPVAEQEEHEDADAEQEAAFTFEAGFAEQALEGAIGHQSGP